MVKTFTYVNAVSASIVLLVSNLSKILSQFLVLVITARLLSPGELGIVSTAVLIITFLLILAELGLSQAVTQSFKIDQSIIFSAFLFGLFQAAIFYSLLLVSSSSISLFFEEPELSSLLRIVSTAIPIHILGLIPEALLLREKKFKNISFAEIISNISHLFAICILLFEGFGVLAIAFSYPIKFFVRSLLLSLLAPKIYFSSLRRRSFNINGLIQLLRYGFGFSIGRFLSLISSKSEQFVIAKTLGPSALSFYQKADEMTLVPITLAGGVLDKIIFPVVASKQKEHHNVFSIYKKSSILLLFIITPLTAFLISYNSQIIDIIFGETWLPVTPLFSILSVCLYVRSQSKVSDSIARGMGFVYTRSSIQFVYSSFIIIGSIIFANYGLTYIALWAASCYALYNLAISILNSSKCGYSPWILIKYNCFALGFVLFGIGIFKIYSSSVGLITDSNLFQILSGLPLLVILYGIIYLCLKRLLKSDEIKYIDHGIHVLINKIKSHGTNNLDS